MEKLAVLVTTTFTANPSGDLRFQLARRTIDAAKRCEYPIIVVDGSPAQLGASEMLARHGAIVFRQKISGMGAARRQAIQAGLEREAGAASAIVWLEPEKHTLVPLLEPCIQLVADGRFDLVIPHRLTLVDYPPYQAASEHLANQALGAITGRPDLDLYMGPRVMTPDVARTHFFAYRGAYGDQWESIFIPVLTALQAGLRVGSVSVDYDHPREQAAAEGTPEMDRKRDVQRTEIIAAMARAARELKFFPRLAGF